MINNHRAAAVKVGSASRQSLGGEMRNRIRQLVWQPNIILIAKGEQITWVAGGNGVDQMKKVVRGSFAGAAIKVNQLRRRACKFSRDVSGAVSRTIVADMQLPIGMGLQCK